MKKAFFKGKIDLSYTSDNELFTSVLVDLSVLNRMLKRGAAASPPSQTVTATRLRVLVDLHLSTSVSTFPPYLTQKVF